MPRESTLTRTGPGEHRKRQRPVKRRRAAIHGLPLISCWWMPCKTRDMRDHIGTTRVHSFLLPLRVREPQRL